MSYLAVCLFSFYGHNAPTNMVVKQTIASNFFSNRGHLSSNLMGKLLVRGGGVQVDDALRRFGWISPEPVITSVATIDIDSGAVRGFRFETRGSLPEVKFKAGDLWPEARQGLMVSFNLSDMSILDWLNEGDTRNQTAWIDSSECSMKIFHQDRSEILDDVEKSNAGIGGMVVKFTTLPIQVDRCILYAGIVPFSKNDLRTKLAEVGSSLGYTNVPTICQVVRCQREAAERSPGSSPSWGRGQQQGWSGAPPSPGDYRCWLSDFSRP